MEKHTTAISADRFRPLEVEWVDYNERPGMGRYKMRPDGTSQRLPGRHISFVIPGWSGSYTRLVDLSPRTALNLLAWLEAERPELEQRAKEAEEADRD